MLTEELSPAQRTWLVRAAWTLSALGTLLGAGAAARHSIAWASVLFLVSIAQALVASILREKPEDREFREGVVAIGAFVVLVAFCAVALAVIFAYLWYAIIHEYLK